MIDANAAVTLIVAVIASATAIVVVMIGLMVAVYHRLGKLERLDDDVRELKQGQGRILEILNQQTGYLRGPGYTPASDD